jgi:radical SAM protein with 4Fe4S-binding SPASM domain
MKHKDIKHRIEQQIIWGHKYRIEDWDISGGEPSILPYWFSILEDMKSFGFRNIACITNGYKFADGSFLKESKDRGLNELLFSLHGSTIKTHDEMTGVEGSYNKLTQAISNAVYYGIKRRINVVVTKRNFTELPKIAKYANYIKPVAFNFLPFRVENSADKKNMIRYSEIAPYIKEAIDILNDDIKVAIRYVPFCLFEGYEKYVAGYLQRAFDEYEWNEYTVRRFDAARFDKDFKLEFEDKWEQEIEAIHWSIKHVANHSTKCLACKYLHVCDGIWYSYAKQWGINEFKPISGNKTENICLEG